MQTLVFNKEKQTAVLYSGVYFNNGLYYPDTKVIVSLENVKSINSTSHHLYQLYDNESEIVLQVPINKTNVIYL